MARYNKIFAGPYTMALPQVRELPAADGNIKPGNLIVDAAGSFTNAGAATTGKVYVAQDNYLAMGGADDAYPSGDVVIGMEAQDSFIYRVRLAASQNVAVGSALTTAANGEVAVATTGDMVVFFADESFNNTSGSAELINARPAKGYKA
ncbi:hypothetical protein [Pseudovibrio exalbescens]|uniref:hypothetical protein n=1 Tax=Pseudovibrio exalbescens TaxID=197461 RepID=UPI000C99B212|nr:hypothetical protein [Pseudovibrio exalbescens]